MLIARKQAFSYHPKRTFLRRNWQTVQSTKTIMIYDRYEIGGQSDIRKGGHLTMKRISGYQKDTGSYSKLFVILTIG